MISETSVRGQELQANGVFPAMGASVLCLGFVATNIFDGARYQAALDAGDITKTTKNEEASKAAIGMMGGKAGGFLQP